MTSSVEPAAVRWRRRALTVPAYLLATAVLVLFLPILLPISALVDVARARRFAASRCLLGIGHYLSCESAGIVASFFVWLFVARDRERFVAWSYWLQSLWARALFAGMCRIFSMRVRVEGEEQVGNGPLLLFVRHASTLDTLLAAVFVRHRHDIRLRYVIKRELLWDPCLDIVGHWIPNVFIRRSSPDRPAEIEAVRRLARGLGPGEGVLIYPEGTRFSEAKRARVLEKLASSAPPEIYERARTLRHVLPPRPHGAQALLEACPDADVVFLAHRGFEAVTSLRDLANGALIDTEIRIRLWRVPAADVPRDGAVALWLIEQWQRMDGWLEDASRCREG